MISMTFQEYAHNTITRWNELETRMIETVSRTADRYVIIAMLNNRPNNVCKYQRVRQLYQRWDHKHG